MNDSCPCKYLDEPCQPMCTCKTSVYSGGCLLCASYGSIERRKIMAQFIKDSVLRNLERVKKDGE